MMMISIAEQAFMKSLAIVTKLSLNQRFLGKREREMDYAASMRFMEFERLTH